MVKNLAAVEGCSWKKKSRPSTAAIEMSCRESSLLQVIV